jgi:hypothetical protein
VSPMGVMVGTSVENGVCSVFGGIPRGEAGRVSPWQLDGYPEMQE